jgi:hypothetical protein
MFREANPPSVHYPASSKPRFCPWPLGRDILLVGCPLPSSIPRWPQSRTLQLWVILDGTNVARTGWSHLCNAQLRPRNTARPRDSFVRISGLTILSDAHGSRTCAPFSKIVTVNCGRNETDWTNSDNRDGPYVAAIKEPVDRYFQRTWKREGV